MPVVDGSTDLLNSELTLSNLISPIGGNSDHELDSESNQSLTKSESDKNQNGYSLSEMLNQLNANYDKTEEKINETFESLRFALENRKTYLLNELKLFYEEKKASVSIQPNEELLLEKFDLETTSSVDVSKKTANHLDSDLINNIINNYGKIVRLKNASSLFECSIEGKGLSQCVVNEESCFTLSFKNKHDLRLSNVSFLDIYIITSDNTSDFNQPKYQSSTSSSRASSSTSSSSKSTNLRYAKTANCDCTLEVLADGVYMVKYKLTKRGVYSLNILVNKKHIGKSPYRLVCGDRLSSAKNGVSRMGVKATSTLNVRSANSSALLPNGRNIDHSRTRSRPDSSKSSNLMKSLYNAKSTSSASLLLPSSSSLNYSYSTPRSVTPSQMANKNKSHFSSTIFTNNRFKSSPTTKSSKHNNSNNTSHDDSLISSAPSSTILGDSLSSPSPISPAVSKTNINLSASTAFISSSSSSMRGNNGIGFGGVGLEDDFLFQIGRRGRANSEFMNPQAVCATADTIYVTDSNNQKIEAFSHNGEYKFTMGVNNSTASNTKLVRRPIGIDSNCEGKILCVDYELKCVNVFEESGKFLQKICQNRLLGPKGISINKAHHNQIVIADSKANSVCIFDADGKFLQRFGNLGSKNENFAGPQYLSCMSTGDIVVTDFYNHCIKVFDFEGKFKFSFGSNGSEQGQFNGPTGVSTDSQDNIIVVDWGNSRIQVFDKHGNFLRFINSEYNQLYGPQDVAIINNTIAVADSGNHCVKIFEYS